MNILNIINKLNDPMRDAVVELASNGATLTVNSVNDTHISYEVISGKKSVFKANMYVYNPDLLEHITMLEMLKNQFGGK